ncbi:hypothetical protein G5B47_12785 [Paenibacillus sp. 7124]|uniref:Uncharacterized protein n=1 Tax=Paenibacillus apii TaxID=1850370 RepID=A0A6M1PLS0_9BACL|nr:hypothetical protein [Paenibacillus apii]NGM83292.1 hypothetical protein [Paenibacillus apii]NJJ38941.1 hypothetical protein [Paenibacillus apii]
MSLYIDRNARSGLIRLVLALLLALVLPASATFDWHSPLAQDSAAKGIEKQAHHFASTSARQHPKPHIPGTLPLLPVEQDSQTGPNPGLVPLRSALFYPIIYNLLKRLLLNPLKFTSNYVVYFSER